MEVSIVIVNYNTKKITNDTINSIFNTTKFLNFEIILVDNASSDGSFEFFSKFKNIKYIYLDKNVGFGQANNIGVENCNGKYILLLNSDIILINDLLSDIYYFYKENYSKLQIGVLGSILLNQQKKITHSYVHFKSIHQHFNLFFNKLFNLFIKNEKKISIKSSDKKFIEVDGALGACMFLEKKIFMKLNGFDENIFLYGEETELQKRVKDLGYKNYCINFSKIIHLEGGSSNKNNSKLSPFTIIQLKFGDLYFINKHKSRLYYNFYLLIQYFTWLPFLILDRRFSFNFKSLGFKILLNHRRFIFKEKANIKYINNN